MPAFTPSTTLHGRDIMAPVVATPVPTWARTIFTEVGKEILEHAQQITDDWASSTYAGLRHLARDFRVALDGRNVPWLKYVAGRFILLAARAIALCLARLALTENCESGTREITAAAEGGPSLQSPKSTSSEEQTAMYFSGGRKPTLRSVRIVSMQDYDTMRAALARLDSARPPAEMPPEKTPSPANSQDSHLLDTNALNATASAPEHPSTPISVAASLSTPPCTSSPSGSVAPTTASKVEYYQGIFQCFGSHGSTLTVVPFNQGSKQNVETLVDYNYMTLGLDLDYVIPFAAVSENGFTSTSTCPGISKAGCTANAHPPPTGILLCASVELKLKLKLKLDDDDTTATAPNTRACASDIARMLALGTTKCL
ncbi:hypothetical protein V8E52_001961 [Russula decolorans]